MMPTEMVHSLACKTAREFLQSSQELGLDSGDAFVSIEIFLTITILTMSIMMDNPDHKRYMMEILDVMTENCVAHIHDLDIIEFGR